MLISTRKRSLTLENVKDATTLDHKNIEIIRKHFSASRVINEATGTIVFAGWYLDRITGQRCLILADSSALLEASIVDHGLDE